MSVRAFIVAIVFALLAVAAPSPSAAHAALVASDPAEGSVEATPPAAVTLTFTEPVVPTALSVVGVGVAPRSLSFTQPDGPIVDVVLPPGLADGSYLLSWRVTSADGHPVNGTIGFAIGAPSGALAAAAPSAALDAGIWLVRVVQYAALFLGVGSLCFGLVASVPAGVRRLARGLVVTGLALVPVALALQGLDLRGDDAPALISAAPWLAALATPFAWTEGALLLAYSLALLAPRPALAAAAIAGAIAPALSGHVVTAAPQALTHLLLIVHVASLIFWIGALLPLGALLRDNAMLPLLRFSRAAPAAVGLLLVSGISMAAIQMGWPGPEWTSPYGLLLGVKLILVAGLLLVALWNRIRLTARAIAGDSVPLRRSIVVELVLAGLIFAVVAGWRFTPPPRVLAEVAAASAPVRVTLSAGTRAASAMLTPGRPGPVRLDIVLPIAAQSVTVHLANPGADVATLTRAATGSDGGWRVDGLLLPVGGTWTLAVDARTGDFDVTQFSGQFGLAPSAGEATMLHPTAAAVAVSSALLAGPAVAAPGILDSCPTGQTFSTDTIIVTGAFTRATPKGAPSAGGYLVVGNRGDSDDTLTGATSPAAHDITLHQMKMNGNVMEMSAVAGGLTVPAGGSVSLDPMGYHLMLVGMDQAFVEGQCVQMTLHFAKAGDLPIELNIGAMGSPSAPTGKPNGAAASMPMDHQMSGMDMPSMSGM